ncbi:type II secretion system GspH family protein [Patescibacteria group bacterium]|nr:type II secretion system GspH family protein [Patescibacteria group bacterium]MBU2036273.1 type II secretion system GspH family protein [Patescibacteria group bacterium]
MDNAVFLNKRNKKGFTLTELLIVVSIIVFLAALVIFYLRNQIFKGNDAKRKGDVHSITIAMEEYEKDNDCYPTVDLVICKPGTGLKPYLSKIPCDPTTDASYVVEVEGTCPSWYRIYINLENTKDKDIEKIGCTYGCGPYYAYNFFVSSPNAPDPIVGVPPETSVPSEPPAVNYYGCINGVCEKILWDPERPGPECDPHFENSTCYGWCGDILRECKNWEL